MGQRGCEIKDSVLASMIGCAKERSDYLIIIAECHAGDIPIMRDWSITRE